MNRSQHTFPMTLRIQSGVLSLVALLCLCVLFQMLGVPATLLSPGDAADTLGASVLEGFSLLPSLPQLALRAYTWPVVDTHALVHVPVLASAPFHPPVL